MTKLTKLALFAAVSSLVSFSALAAYPDRPIKLIVPWAAGGDTDNIFRPFAPLLQKHVGETVVIANVGGASGTKGAKEAKASPPDGYTLYAVHDYIHMNSEVPHVAPFHQVNVFDQKPMGGCLCQLPPLPARERSDSKVRQPIPSAALAGTSARARGRAACSDGRARRARGRRR